MTLYSSMTGSAFEDEEEEEADREEEREVEDVPDFEISISF